MKKSLIFLVLLVTLSGCKLIEIEKTFVFRGSGEYLTEIGDSSGHAELVCSGSWADYNSDFDLVFQDEAMVQKRKHITVEEHSDCNMTVNPGPGKGEYQFSFSANGNEEQTVALKFDKSHRLYTTIILQR